MGGIFLQNWFFDGRSKNEDILHAFWEAKATKKATKGIFGNVLFPVLIFWCFFFQKLTKNEPPKFRKNPTFLKKGVPVRFREPFLNLLDFDLVFGSLPGSFLAHVWLIFGHFLIILEPFGYCFWSIWVWVWVFHDI